MRIEALRLVNFRSLKDVHMRNIPAFCVLIGANGTGKSTLFSVFAFLREAMASNVTTALQKLGGSRGFQEVRSRGSNGPIVIELKIRAPVKTGKEKDALITYTLEIDEVDGQVVVASEILKYRRGNRGRPWHFLDFRRGEGTAVVNELDKVSDENDLKREEKKLKGKDILAIKGLAQFDQFPAAVEIGKLIERWHLSDFHITRARPEQEANYAEHLSTSGENLSNVIEFLHKRHPTLFKEVLKKMSERVPGVANVESKVTEEGRVLLKFHDGAFQDPFLARHVSDGTIKMLAYLVLLFDPTPHPLLCIEEPENQLYPSLLEELAEEFRAYAERGGQVFVTTHSPDFLNAVTIEETFFLVKQNGYTRIVPAVEDTTIVKLTNSGDKLGYLWKQGLISGVDPQ